MHFNSLVYKVRNEKIRLLVETALYKSYKSRNVVMQFILEKTKQ